MFKFTRVSADDRDVWEDEDAEQFQVHYNDGGLQQRLTAHLQSNRADRPHAAPVSCSAVRTQHTLQRQAYSPSQSPSAADVHALIGDLQHLTQAAFRDRQQPEVALGESLNGSEPIRTHHVLPQVQDFLSNSTAAVLDTSRQLLADLLEHRPPPQPQHEPQHVLQQPQTGAAARETASFSNPWSQHPQHEQHEQQDPPLREQLRWPAQQSQHQPQRLQQQLLQEQQQAPASFSQLLAPQQQKPAAAKQPQKGQQQRRKSILYSTPQQHAPKKKPRFSIKDTASSQTVHRTPAAALRPDPAAGAAAPAGASHQGLPGSQAAGLTGPSALAALLGSNTALTPARQKSTKRTMRGLGRTGESTGAAVAIVDNSQTPASSSRKAGFGTTGLYPTPQFSTNKGFRLAQGLPGEQETPAPSLGTAAAAAGASVSAAAQAGLLGAAAAAEDDADLTGVPAALFQDEETAAAADGNLQQQQPPETAAEQLAVAQVAAETPAISRDQATRGRRSSTTTPNNSLLLMQEQRERRAHFLSALPAAATVSRATALNSNAGMLSCLAQNGGRGVPVPAGSSLSKVLGQVVAAQKEQQEQLQQQLAAGAAGVSADADHLELEICSKHWEAHMVKCLCTVTHWQQQQQASGQPNQHPLQQQQQQQASGQPNQPPLQQQQQQQQASGQPAQHLPQQQQQQRLGEHVYLCLASKTALSVDLDPGRRIRVHPPWYDVAQLVAGQPPVVLAYLLSSVI